MTNPEEPRGRAVLARLRGVRKTYGDTAVLDLPELDIYAGQVLGVVGENGAGKSTLMGTLSGSVQRDAVGEIQIGGHALASGAPQESQRLGVALVSQEFPLVSQLSVAENLLLGRKPRTSRRRVLTDRRAMTAESETLLTDIGLPPGTVNVRQKVKTVPVPTRQLIEIAKAWGRRPRLLILDEPTSSLGPIEAELVLNLARRHAADGGAVLFIGHRLDEVRDVSDRIIVLRNGRLVADFTREEATEARLINAMVGIEVLSAEPVPYRGGDEVLSVSGLTADGLGPVDLRVHAGEIVGVAGLMGSGRSRLVHTIAGAQPSTGGRMAMNGKRYHPHSPEDGTKSGITLIPEDRKLQSLITFRPISENVTMGLLRQLSGHGLIGPRNVRENGQRITDPVHVLMRSVDQPIGALSGGNQQRAIFGRAFAASPKLLLLDEPTRGVDIGAKAEIYELIEQAAGIGMAVLCVSSELEELLRLCHRIVVLRGGQISAEFDRADATKEKVMTAAASGVTGGPAGAIAASGTASNDGGNR